MNKETLRARLAEFTGPEDILCLHAIAQPLVSEMQSVIRFQHEQAQIAAGKIAYLLSRISREERYRNLLGCGTEVYAQITEAAAMLSGTDVHVLRDRCIPGSADIHRPQPGDE